MALFISFEGGEGSGKSTQAQMLEERLRLLGAPVVSVHEPGTTHLGLYLREWLKRGRPFDSELAEFLLFASARAELVSQIVQPSLNQGTIVLADRFSDSSVAYQGYGRGLPIKLIDEINTEATGGITPDITFLLDCPPKVGLTRVGASFQLKLFDSPGSAKPVRESEGTRFEQEPIHFHENVRSGFRILAEKAPERWRVVDATLQAGEISDIVWEDVEAALGRPAEENGHGPRNGILPGISTQSALHAHTV